MSAEDDIRRLFELVIRGEEDLHFFQEEAVDFCESHPFSALFVDLGLGKTVIMLTLIARLLNLFPPSNEKILIIAPLKVAVNVWPDEIKLWGHTCWIKHTLIREDDDDPRIAAARASVRTQTKRELLASGEFTRKIISATAGVFAQQAETAMRHRIRRELAQSPAMVHIINREAVEWLCNFYGAKWPYRTVIIDESHSFQDHNSNRFNALKKIRNDPTLITRMHLLTATPSSESYMQFFAQLYLLDRGKRLGKNITVYRTDYFDFNIYSRKYKLRPGADDMILKKISDLTLVMKKEDYLPRDHPTIYSRTVHLSETQRKLYDKMQRDLIMTLPSGVEIEAITAAVLAGKLLQMASGAVYETTEMVDYDTGDVKKIRKVHELHDHKVEMLREIIDELNGRQLLVAYHFNSSLTKLKKAFSKAIVMDKKGDNKTIWNSRKLKYPVMFIHPQSGGDGLNLQAGGSNLVFFDIPNSLRQYLQLIGRLDRQGQPDPVVVQLLVAAATRDEDAWGALKVKEEVQDVMFRKLKSLIAKYLRSRNLEREQLEAAVKGLR